MAMLEQDQHEPHGGIACEETRMREYAVHERQVEKCDQGHRDGTLARALDEVSAITALIGVASATGLDKMKAGRSSTPMNAPPMTRSIRRVTLHKPPAPRSVTMRPAREMRPRLASYCACGASQKAA